MVRECRFKNSFIFKYSERPGTKAAERLPDDVPLGVKKDEVPEDGWPLPQAPTFVGAFPMDDPRYVILAMIDEPKGNESTLGYATGGWVAAPLVGVLSAGVAAALIPVGLAGYGLQDNTIWRLAALIFLVFDNGIIASFVSSYRPVKGTFDPDRLAVVLVSSLEVVEQGSLLAVLLLPSFENGPALYVTALIANICQAGFIFVRFVESTFRHESDVLPD